MTEHESQDRALGCLLFCAILVPLFFAAALAWNVFVTPPSGFAP